MKIKWYNTIESTFSAMEKSKKQLHHKDVWAAYFQTAGRGQRGNVWYSDAGHNLTFSIYLLPQHVPACEQFSISQAISLGVCRYLDSRGVEATVKWPNDIYVGGNKICGILISHTLSGASIKDTIAGIGLNINQQEFPQEIPNPTSLNLATGKTYVIENELEALLNQIFYEYDAIGPSTPQRYLDRLYLKDEPHTFTVAATKEKLDGCITGVAPDGRLIIAGKDGSNQLFAFKEIIY